MLKSAAGGERLSVPEENEFDFFMDIACFPYNGERGIVVELLPASAGHKRPEKEQMMRTGKRLSYVPQAERQEKVYNRITYIIRPA